MARNLHEQALMWPLKKSHPPADAGPDLNTKNADMIRTQICARDITNPRVIDALARTDRRVFVPDDQALQAYEDHPIPLMPGATVSQPFIVALMTDLLDVQPHHRVLEIGSGSGYQAAVLALLAAEVWGIELQPELVQYARERIEKLNLSNVHIIHGDGWKGYPDAAPYDRIIVTAAPSTLPGALIDQLATGGRMVVPIGIAPQQNLEVLSKDQHGEITRIVNSPVRFVPLVQAE